MKKLRRNAFFACALSCGLLFCCTFLWMLFWTFRYFQKESQQNGRLAAVRPLLVFYNRIPKTGSTTFVNAIGYDLSAINGFHVAHLNLTKNRYQMNAIDQARLAQNLSNWQQMQPLFLHGHFAFVDFKRLGFTHPPVVWINLLREPFDRFLSYYYFLRYGDNYRIGLRRSKAGNNETFDECFQRGGKECHPASVWLQIPYFCGTAHFCTVPGNQQALQLAKRNLLENYLLVGLSERIEQTVLILERLLPAFFRGAGEHFHALNENRKRLRHTIRKVQPSIETEQKFKQHLVYRMEREFYEFGKAEFDSVWWRSTDGRINGGEHQFVSEQYHFEKIRR